VADPAQNSVLTELQNPDIPSIGCHVDRLWLSFLLVVCKLFYHLPGKPGPGMSGNLTAVRDFTKSHGKNLVREKWPKTVYC